MKKTEKAIILLAIAIIVIVFGVAAFFNVNYAEKIFPNITINGEDYSGLTKERAYEKLNNKIKDIYKDGLVFSYKDKTYKADISKIGVGIDAEAMANDAFEYGHKTDKIESLKEQFYLLNNKKDFGIKIYVNDTALENYVGKEMSKLEDPPKNFNYKYEKGIFVPASAKPGIVINREKMKKEITENLLGIKNDVVKIELVKKEPEVEEDKNNDAVSQAYNMLNNKIALKYNAGSWEVPKDDLVSWIKFVPLKNNGKTVLTIAPNTEKINDYLASMVPQVNIEPVNAQLGLKDGKVDVFALSREGIALQIEKSADSIGRTVFVAANYRDNSAKNIEVQLAFEKVQPEITTEDIDNMGITALLATGESDFSGSPKNRRHNIAVGAGKFQGILVGPGDEFSFNKILGKVGPKEGYLPELVIKKGATIPEYGGGICQVSTTVFRAAVLAGLEITERRNHAYAVKYYNPQGMDATIYPPSPDLKFKNNTPAYILIQTRIEGNKLYFDFYGSDDGRKVVAGQPKVYDKKADGSMKADWTQEVYDKDGNLVFKKTFHSVYKSPALYPHTNPFE